MKTFLSSYLFSVMQVLTLFILSLAMITDWRRDTLFFLLLLAIITLTSFSAEYWYNGAEEKTKRSIPHVAFFVFPVNLAICVLFVLLVF